MKDLEKILSKKYIDFLKKNKVNIGSRDLFEKKDFYFRIKKFFTISEAEYLIKINEEYQGRFGDDFFIIADADNGDYLLMNNDGKVFFWNHEIHDLAFNIDAPKPSLITKNIETFLSSLIEYDELDIEPEVKSIKLSDDFNDLFKDYLK